MEWGEEAYAVMERLKALLDPDGILSPGVLLNDAETSADSIGIGDVTAQSDPAEPPSEADTASTLGR